MLEIKLSYLILSYLILNAAQSPDKTPSPAIIPTPSRTRKPTCTHATIFAIINIGQCTWLLAFLCTHVLIITVKPHRVQSSGV